MISLKLYTFKVQPVINLPILEKSEKTFFIANYSNVNFQNRGFSNKKNSYFFRLKRIPFFLIKKNSNFIQVFQNSGFYPDIFLLAFFYPHFSSTPTFFLPPLFFTPTFFLYPLFFTPTFFYSFFFITIKGCLHSFEI